MAFDDIATTLAKLEAANLRRTRYAFTSSKAGVVELDGRHYLNFASNDYLGLSQHQQVLQAYVEGLAVYGSGSGASPLVSGYSLEHKALEDDLCEVLNKPSALLFSSGFAANQALCHTLFGERTATTNKSPSKYIVCDKYMHASFVQGALTSNCELRRFKHNDVAHAHAQLESADGDTLLATEGVFSMDGDMGKLAQLIELKQQAKSTPWLMLDEAHSFGVIGKQGFGCTNIDGVSSENVDVIMGTFGKALGTSGAFIAGSRELIELLINTCKHYIYSTAMCAAQVRATRVALSLVEIGEEREALHNNIRLFTGLAKQADLALLPSDTAIQSLVIGDPKRVVACADKLKELGLWVPAIRTPTVPKGADRLRITLSALHTEQDITALVDGLAIVLNDKSTFGANCGANSSEQP